jgi:thiol-disulfide isomerase/thioredoxin
MKLLQKILIFISLFHFSFSTIANESSATFKIKTVNDKIFDLKDYKGKIIIINFWAKWCQNCMNEMPILNEIYRRYNIQGVEIIGVNLDHKKHFKEILEISNKLSYPNALISDVVDMSFLEPKFIPFNYIIDKKGKVVAIIDNPDIELKLFEKTLQTILAM